MFFLLVFGGFVNAEDKSELSVIREAYGSSSGSEKWDPVADLNGDGIINVYDLALASKNNVITSENYGSLQGGTTIISVDPTNTVVRLGENFSVNINVTDALATYAYEFKLSWNTSIINLISFTNGTFLIPGGEIFCGQDVNYTEGWLLFGCSLLEPAISQSGNGTLAMLNFTVLSKGSSLLDLYNTYLLDDNLVNYTHESKDGNVISAITSPTIIIISPMNNTSYYKTSILLNFTVDLPETLWIGYSLNNTPNVTITGPRNLTEIANGLNNITIFTNDTLGNMDSSDTAYFFYCLGDITGDKKVDGKDIALVSKYFGTACVNPSYNSTYDLNDDCKIDGKDIALVSKRFGKVCS